MNGTIINTTSTRWCSAPDCMSSIKIERRHFFRFPKERERWLKWIKACNRMDLITMGPEYANQYYRLCHLHFQIQMFRNIEGRIYLSKEAVPSIFLRLIHTEKSATSQLQPISFVTVFLKPESRNGNPSNSLPAKNSDIFETQAPSDKDTPIISSLEAFPRATIKQLHKERNISTTKTTLLEAKVEHDNRSTSEAHLVKDICANLVVPTLPYVSPTRKHSNEIRKYCHVSTQTPNIRIDIDSFLKKRQMENSENHIKTLTAKRMKQTLLSTEDKEHYRVDADQFKAADLLSPNSVLLISACIDALERNKVMRCSFEGKQFALELFFMAPNAYRLYRPLCLLPSVRQLWRHIRNWDMPAGLNDNVLNALFLKVKSLPPLERRCCLCVSEMRLRPHLFYNLTRDRIVGFHNIGAEKQQTLARKVLVMTARSLTGDWEQPIAYYFHSGICAIDVTKHLIFQAIIRLRDIGVTVHALVTNTAPIFLRLSRRLNICAEHPSFLVDNERIFYVFDVTRLMKATRNILINHELHFQEKRASWVDIELFFRYDSQMRLPLVPKLSVVHLEPNKYQRTETKYATEIFSDSMAAGLSLYIASGVFPLKAIGTMELVRNFDQLFNILNSTTPNGKDFGQVFTGNAHEICFLQRMLDFLKSIKVMDRDGVCVESIKCFDRWQISINAVIQLWDTLKEHQLPYLRTRRLSQAGIEHIFRSIRRQSGNRARPTPILFTRAFTNLVSKYLLEHSSSNDSVVKARNMLKQIASSSMAALSSSSSMFQADRPLSPSANHLIVLNVATTKYRDIEPRVPEKISFKRICEYLLDECSRAHNCDICRDVRGLSDNALDSVISYVFNLENVFIHNFEKFAVEANVGARMLQLAERIEYKPPCPNFPVTFLIKLYLRMRIYITLLRHNKICKATESRDSLKVLKL